ncbi:hypothetical protein [Hymenobacter sp. BT190]|uniref:hypothetical protein n=1 Tax=Hymenobacter sp. BT190 TaxID=2763505 RepID=UPI0021C9F9B3|nr:hypothetical protein [Hymenobacter sp. BT190]
MNLPLLDRIKSFTKSASSPGGEDKKAAATVAAVRQALPELLAVAVVELATNKVLAKYSSSAQLQPEKAAMHNAEVVRQKQRALKALALPNEKIEDILITLREQLHLLRVSQNGNWLLYLIVSPQDTNLAIARDVLKTHSL